MSSAFPSPSVLKKDLKVFLENYLVLKNLAIDLSIILIQLGLGEQTVQYHALIYKRLGKLTVS